MALDCQGDRLGDLAGAVSWTNPDTVALADRIVLSGLVLLAIDWLARWLLTSDHD